MTPTAPVIEVGRFPITEHVPIAQGTWRLTFSAPGLARRIAPGQFVMVRAPDRTDPLLGRAFALYDTTLDADGQPDGVAIVYCSVGKLTNLLPTFPVGAMIEVWGPLGRAFPDYTGTEHLVVVAGGIGQTPFVSLIRRVLGQKGYGGQPARAEVGRVTCFYGVRSADRFAGLDDFTAAGAEMHLATDDGTRGYSGSVTELLTVRHQAGQLGGAIRLAGCEPEPMLRALAAIAERLELPCDLSLETPMACGTGLCFTCVTRVRQADGSWDYRRVCVEGPVFDARQLVLECEI
ncbi:MAG TPA: dihydroorotate dehydrogenase electron transfer subunit [Gemmatales bacterium]|nr:dihydroorotate dehydrogenase electron transfer subunit [Gemmatales bacterium]